MRMGDGHVKKEDILWLDTRLKGLKKNSGTLIFFSHYPLADGLDNWFEVTDILKANGCRLCFCGHGHKLTLLNFDGMTGIMGRAVITSGSDKPGYNIVEVAGDSVRVYNKEPGISKGQPLLALDYVNTATVANLARSPRPDFSVNSGVKEKVKVREFTDKASIFTGPCLINDSLVVFGNSSGDVRAVAIGTGTVMWTSRFAAPVYSTPVYYRGVVAFGTVDGKITGVDAGSGKQKWSITSGRPVLAEGIAEDGNLYIGAGDRDFYKIDMQSGKVLWKFSNVAGLIQGKPALSDDCVIFGAWDRHLYCLNKDDGSLRWKWNNDKPQQLYSPGNIVPVVSGNTVFIVAPDRFMTAINIETGKETWRTAKHQVRESMGISADKKLVYAKLMNDTLIAMSAVAGTPVTVWAKNQAFGYEHNPCPVKATDKLIVNGTRTGVIIASDASSGEVSWKYKAGSSSVINLVIDPRGNIWFTLAEGKAGCLIPLIN
jgi:outer membrane protein assembly factor BamB